MQDVIDDSQESLKEFIRAENEKLRNELVGKIKDLEVSMAVSQKDLLVKIFAIIVGTVGVAVTILKLF